VQGFDDTYSAYADHQNRMERFWCLRWLQQEQRERAVASVVKGDLVRLDDIPLMMHVPGLGVHARGTKLLLEISDFDELMIEASCRVVQVLDAPSASATEAEAETADEEIEDTSKAGAQSDTTDEAPGAEATDEADSDDSVEGRAGDIDPKPNLGAADLSASGAIDPADSTGLPSISV